jgi:hypothetical protein
MTDTFVGSDDNVFAERMLEHGYFPENLPPVFAVTNLYEAALSVFKTKDYITDKATEGAKYNASKRGGQRRLFVMPNPVFMVDAAKFFMEHKVQIEEHLATTEHSCSYPIFSKEDKRPIKISSFPEFYKRRRRALSLSRFIVKTDISRFYHSIYTHSVPWALHSKQAAKKDRNPKSETIFGNRLDWLLRQSQDGQTVGIPVGPDFSRIISELIGSAIDKKFRGSQGHEVTMLRLVDDIYIGADNLDEANTYLSAIRDSIHSFELDINESKTAILNASDDLEPYWPVEIRREIDLYSQNMSDKQKVKSDFIHFLDDVLRQASARRDEGILKFALRKIDEQGVWADYWEVLEPFLVRSVISFPHSWDYVARVVAWRNKVSKVDKELWQEVIARTVNRVVESGYDSEICWSLWLLKELNASLDNKATDAILKRCGPLSCLLALDTAKSNYKISKEILLDRLGDQPMMGANWILAYEADRQFGLKIKSKNLQGNPFFKQLYEDDVSFYNKEAQPAVFQEVDEVDKVKSAIEQFSSYDDAIEDEEDDTEDF